MAAGQRIKEGCFDSAPLSCDAPRRSPADVTFSLEEVCYGLQSEIFPSETVAKDTSLHADYLNGIDASSELCSQVQIAYSQCFFCHPERDFKHDCENTAGSSLCGGGLPTREEVIENNESEVYARFQTDEDIDATCAELEWAYDGIYPFDIPNTIDLCERQIAVKHLCPGYCDGTCFDEDLNPNSCNPADFSGPFNETLDSFAICDELRYQAFNEAPIEHVLNVSVHLDYLRAVQKNSSFCNQARQAYSQCSWCAEQLCFSEENPATCEAPTASVVDLAAEDHLADIEKACFDIYWSFYDISFPDDVLNVSLHTGRILIPENTTTCNRARQAYHSCYWCAEDPPVDFCRHGTVCASNVSLPENFTSTVLSDLNISTETALDCDKIFQFWNDTWSDPLSMQGCYDDIYLARLCPEQFCSLEDALTLGEVYLGATTTAEKRALIWLSRVAAILSFLGASFILYDTLSDPKARTTTYHQLLVGMAIFDCVTAIAWCFATLPIPKEEAGHVEGAMGTEATCTAQAFTIQLGFTSVFYNASLALYYMLVIAFGWREFQLKKIKLYMHAVPITIGLGLALGAIPSYHWIEYGCHLLPPPEGEMWAVLVFFVIPLGLSIIAITISMLVVYWKVRQRAAASRKWSLGIGKVDSLEKKVFWQCLFYVLAFYVTWPLMFSVYLASIDVDGPLGLTMTVAFVAPLQGFTNFLVYVRPKLSKSRRSSFWKKVYRSVGERATTISSYVQPSVTDPTEQPHDDPLLALDPSAALAHDEIKAFGPRPSRVTQHREQLEKISERIPRLSEDEWSDSQEPDFVPETRQHGTESGLRSSDDMDATTVDVRLATLERESDRRNSHHKCDYKAHLERQDSPSSELVSSFHDSQEVVALDECFIEDADNKLDQSCVARGTDSIDMGLFVDEPTENLDPPYFL
ncbi:expressed unknown protein [Seminavis robusta]|uniref:G-protein coupled receptors family 2 profile 2 domain-containing protein n=1 Tax=Seminavis robusta TaxID=568900 RepID=A0A9N8H2T8_9STRA|nr:expressed unknown protein [Seminavis robusta]|eukprot:Sro43_g026280.1 n/a (921) ;mRNA; r:100646-103508